VPSHIACLFESVAPLMIVPVSDPYRLGLHGPPQRRRL